MRFTPEHLAAFARLSGDRNPLHVDATYAGRTSFGQPVVYGVVGTLLALATWGAGRRVCLQRLRCTFRRPLFVATDYRLEVKQSGERTVLRWYRDHTLHADIVVTTTEAGEDPGPAPGAAFVPRDEAAGDEQPLPPAFPYELAPDFPTLLPILGGIEQVLPYDQIRALAGLSYLVGMECPGAQALFTNLDIQFAGAKPEAANGAPYFRGLRSELDPRFRRARLLGATSTGATFEAAAFVRPRPIDESIDAIAAHLPRPAARRYQGKMVVVTGSSRGFGAALAKAFAIEGAKILVHFRSQHASGASVVDEARRYGSADAVVADLATDEGAATLARGLERHQAFPPDVLVLNATPPIDPVPVKEMSARALGAFVTESLVLAQGPLREIVPQMKPGSVVVLVSSVYVREHPPGFAHYAAAKAALEALVQVYAKEHPGVRFVIARPPRMLTDQTNAPGQAPSDLASPGKVAADLLAALGGAESLVEL